MIHDLGSSFFPEPELDLNLMGFLHGTPLAQLPGGPGEGRRVRLRAQAYQWSGDQLLRLMEDGSTRVVLPRAERLQAIQRMHIKAQHVGEKRVLYLLRLTYWWPGMPRDVHATLSTCEPCAMARSHPQIHRAALHPLKTEPFMFRWQVDLAKIGTSVQGFIRVMVCVEALSRYAVLIPLRNKKSSTCALAFKMHVLGYFGSMAQVLTDRGYEFMNHFHQLLESNLIDHQTTATYSPQSNGLAERLVHFLKITMRKLCNQNPNIPLVWEYVIPDIQLAYNTSVQRSINMAPFTMMFGCAPHIPPNIAHGWDADIDGILNANDPQTTADAAAVVERSELIRRAGILAAAHLRIAQHRDTLRYAYKQSGSYKPRTFRFHEGDFTYLVRPRLDTTQMNVHPHILRVVKVGSKGSVILEGKDRTQLRRNASTLTPCHLTNIDTTYSAERQNQLSCLTCGKDTFQKKLLVCESCFQAWHTFCLQPALPNVPTTRWICSACNRRQLQPEPEAEEVGTDLFHTHLDPQGTTPSVSETLPQLLPGDTAAIETPTPMAEITPEPAEPLISFETPAPITEATREPVNPFTGPMGTAPSAPTNTETTNTHDQEISTEPIDLTTNMQHGNDAGAPLDHDKVPLFTSEIGATPAATSGLDGSGNEPLEHSKAPSPTNKVKATSAVTHNLDGSGEGWEHPPLFVGRPVGSRTNKYKLVRATPLAAAPTKQPLAATPTRQPRGRPTKPMFGPPNRRGRPASPNTVAKRRREAAKLARPIASVVPGAPLIAPKKAKRNRTALPESEHANPDSSRSLES
jgi:hypothetical protein